MQVSLEASRALKAAGYPQDQWPQMAFLHSQEPLLRYQRDELTVPRDGYGEREWFAAPDPLTALDWLEKAKGWHWCREYNSYWKECGPSDPGPDWQARWEGPKEESDHWEGDDFWTEKADTPDGLILAICERFQGSVGQEVGQSAHHTA